MNAVISAVISDLISRFISFIIEKSQTHVATSDRMVSRLQRLLLRATTIVEEAEGRQVTNRGMLLQLKQLRDAMYQGYYALDTFEMNSRQQQGATTVRLCKLQSYTDDLEALLGGMKEFLLVLMHCPSVVRQPYSAYLFMENCMFGHQVEKEHVISFLLRPSLSLDILPVVGPCYVGKRTLVEHACREEMVQRNFSQILRFSGADLNNLVTDDAMDNCRKLSGSDDMFLIVVELVHDADVVAWGKFYRSLCHGACGSKAILISPMDQVSSLGTVQALRLTRLHQEEYWYFFRVLAFGSANPYDHHQDLIPIARKIAMEIDGDFMMTSVVTRVLRGNMSMQFWLRALGHIKRSIQMHILVFGEDPRDRSNKTFCPYFYSFRGGSLIFCYNRYEVIGSMMSGDMKSAKMTEDVLNGAVMRYGEKFNMISQSPIPPYYYYITNCVVKSPKRVIESRNKCLKRKRNPDNNQYVLYL